MYKYRVVQIRQDDIKSSESHILIRVLNPERLPMAKQSKAKNSAKPSAKSEVVAKLVTTQKEMKSQKPKGVVPNYAKKARPPESSFLDLFKKFEEKQKATGLDLFNGPLGKYAVQVGQSKMVVQSFENNKGVQFECLETDFGFSTRVFLSEKLVQIFSTEDFVPNFKLPLDVQDEQKSLHNFLRDAHELTDEYKASIARKQEKPLFTLVPKPTQPYNKFASFAREERTCNDIRKLVMGRVQVYRIADQNGKYAVMSLSSKGDVVKVVQITLQYLQDGHELEGQLTMGTLVELHKLARVSLGTPHGLYAEQQKNQGVLHAWLRKVALDAGIKDKPAKAKLSKAA